MEDKTLTLLHQLLTKFGPNELAKGVGVNVSTLKRWVELGRIPSQYYFELCRFGEVDLNYKDFTYKEKDQFFTSPETALKCYEKTLEVIGSYGYNCDDYTFIEPSAGDGSFFSLLPEDRRIGIDIEPRFDGIQQGDFLKWSPTTDKNIVIGNPPFGMRGNLALKFINHSSQFADFVCFIVPQLFGSDGKGSCMKRVEGLNLIHNETISSEFHYPDGKKSNVYCVFQIWSKHIKIEKETPDLTHVCKIYSLSDGGTPDTTRNKQHHYTCDYYIQSSCFGSSNLSLSTSFDDMDKKRGSYGIKLLDQTQTVRDSIERIDWGDVCFVSTNGAVNLRTSIIEESIWKELPDHYKSSIHKPVGLESFFN